MMAVVKILGGIDLAAAVVFLMLIFGIDAYTQVFLFAAGLLFVKGLFIITGEIVLSTIDLGSSILLIIAIFLPLPIVLAWIPAFLLTAKGVISFL